MARVGRAFTFVADSSDDHAHGLRSTARPIVVCVLVIILVAEEGRLVKSVLDSYPVKSTRGASFTSIYN